MDAADLRDGIPLLDGTTYLNTGSSGPSPRRVRDAMDEALDAHAEEHADEPYRHEASLADEARDSVADLLCASSDEVALTSNTTDGINLVADLFDWGPDDAVVTTALEHPAGVLPWRRIAEVRGTDVRAVPTDDDRSLDRDAYKEAVRGAVLVCTSSVSWYGVRNPVAELVEVAHDAGASVVVDAAQSVGAEDVEVSDWGAEYVAAPAHKWLLGPWGAGLLYVADDAPRDAQTRVGYKSAVSPNESAALRDGARRFEVSTASPAAHAGTSAAVETLRSVGLDDVEDRVARLVGRLEDRLGDRHVSSAGGLVRFEDATPEETVERLKNESVVLRALPDGTLRASLHAFNTSEDVDRLTEVL